MTSIYQALEHATLTLTQASQKNARLEAQILLRHILHIERSVLYAYPERVLTPEQEQQFLSFIERRSRGEPIAYLTGHKEFYGLDFLVDKRVLIPRPETELLVEAALHACRQMFDAGRTPIVADIGTGSGIIPVTLAVLEPRLPYLYASDISTDALDVAYLNCLRHHVENRIHLLFGDLLAPLPEPIDILTANLPYVGTDELDELMLDVRAFEPHLALFSGPLGLDLLRRFFIELQHSQKLAERAILLLEIGYQQREALTSMLQEIWPHANLAFTKDSACWDRVLQVTL
jgi:release factor glutamine methyltransferase